MDMFLSFTGMVTLAVLSPGADFALVTKNALSQSRSIALASALGVSLAILYHTSYSILGLSVLIRNTDWAFSVVKYVGAAYLLYLGIKDLFLSNISKNINKADLESGEKIGIKKALVQGFLCNALNPKTTMFFIAVFSIVVTDDSSVFVKILYGLEVCLLHLVWFSMVAFLMTSERFQRRIHKFNRAISKIMGVFLISIAFRLIFL